jgi:hypothetical protein
MTFSRIPLNIVILAAGVDDYLAKPLTPLQARTRVLVGKRWLAYIDSLFAGRK